MLVEFSVFHKDGVVFDLPNAFSVWGYIENAYFVFFPNFNGVTAYSSAVLGISWSSFFGAKDTSSSAYSIPLW